MPVTPTITIDVQNVPEVVVALEEAQTTIADLQAKLAHHDDVKQYRHDRAVAQAEEINAFYETLAMSSDDARAVTLAWLEHGMQNTY